MRVTALILALMIALVPTAWAGGEQGVYALVVKDQSNPYMQKMFEGFAAACAELGRTPRMAGPPDIDAMAQAGVIDDLVAEGALGIAVAVNDQKAAEGPLMRAMDAGVQVVSVDSAASPGARMTHIQQVDPVLVSRALMQAARRMIGGSGEAAILSTTEAMPNQSTWVRLMLSEVESHRDDYQDMPIVEVAYGLDETEASIRETERLLDTYPNLRIIIAPTSVGLKAAAETIRARGADVLVTGLGLPSEMAAYIQDGTCPWMYLWNPIDMGYLAAYALSALEAGQITGAMDDAFTAGRIGERLITRSEDGGTEVVVGNPYKFDKNNILLWQSAF